MTAIGTVNGIDRELADWQDRQRLIDENLDSFALLPVFQRLSSPDEQAALAGQSQQRVIAAIELFRDLRAQQSVLASTLDRARQLRSSLSRLMPARQTLEEIEQILNGQSIQLESSPTPTARRELLRDVEQSAHISLARLLEIMLDSFRFVRDTLVGLESAEQENARDLELHRSELSRLQNLSASFGGQASAELDAAAQSVSEITAITQHDPLAAAERISELANHLRTIAETLDAISGRRLQIEEDLRQACTLIDQVRETHNRAKRAFAERELKIQSPRDASVPMPSGDDEMEMLASWLAKLQSTVQKGEYGPAGIGLKKWADSAEMLLASDRRSADADEASLRSRRDLRGLFEALQAKACNCGRAEEARLMALGGEISQLLARRPTPMQKVRELVSQYQQFLVL